MSNCIQIDKNLYLNEYSYKDKEEFNEWYKRFPEPNYQALLIIWNRGIDVYLIFKKVFIWNINVGFISLIDYNKLSNREKEMMEMMQLPRRYNGTFINDMRISTFFRHKGIGTKVVTKIFESKNIYMLDPTEDGKRFWKKFGFEHNKDGKYAVLDNR